MELGKTNQGKKNPKQTPSVGLWMSSICLQRAEMGRTSEREQIAPSLDPQIVYSIFHCGVLRGRKEVMEAGFVNRGKKIFAAYFLQKWVNQRRQLLVSAL